MDDFETIYDKVEMDCRCEDIVSQEEGRIDKFRYKQVEASVNELLRGFGFYEKDD